MKATLRLAGLLVGAAFLLTSLPASAEGAASTLSAAFANTVEVTDGDTAYSAYYNADGTFTNSLGMAGTWTLEGDQLTLFVDGSKAGATTLPAGKSVGDAFAMTDETGKSVQVKITEGRP